MTKARAYHNMPERSGYHGPPTPLKEKHAQQNDNTDTPSSTTIAMNAPVPIPPFVKPALSLAPIYYQAFHLPSHSAEARTLPPTARPLKHDASGIP